MHGGTKTHALIANETGEAIGFGLAGPGSWEISWLPGLTENLLESTSQALGMAKIDISQISGSGLGLAGYDWPASGRITLTPFTPFITLFMPFLKSSMMPRLASWQARKQGGVFLLFRELAATAAAGARDHPT